MPQIDYLKQDYDAFLEMFYELIDEEFPDWSKYNENNIGEVFGKFLAMLGDIESFYKDKMIHQLMLPTTTLRKFAILICKSLGYKLSSATPSKVEQVQFEILPKETEFTIPAGYPIGTKAINTKGEYIHFETDEPLVFPAGTTTGIVSATNGLTISLEPLGVSNGNQNQRFVLENRKAIDGKYEVFVNENNVLKTWTEVETFVGQGAKDIFITEIDEIDRTYIVFGDGINGRKPPQGSEIFCTYVIGGGSNTNVGIGTITENKGDIIDIVSITNLTPATGGKDRETIEEAKQNAPIFFKTSERAVTRSDFITLSKRVEGVKRAQALSNGTIIDVYIASSDNNGIPTEELKNSVFSYLNERKIITFIINILEPNFPKVDVTATIIPSSDVDSTTAIEAVKAKLNEIFSIDNKDFEQGEKLGYIYSQLLNLDEVDTVEISKFTTQPIVYSKTQSATPAHTFDTVNILQANTLAGEWKVTMTTETDFTVEFYDADTNSYVNKGTGTIGTLFTSSGNEIQFTITSNGGTSSIGDYWVFYTNKYLGNITKVFKNEILKPGIFNIT